MKEKHSPEMTQALSLLTLRSVFFTALTYSMKIEAKDDLPAPAATDGVHLYYNPKLFATYSKDDRVFILAHEVMHTILMHSMRLGARKAMAVTPDGSQIPLANIAMDYCVNGLMAEHDFPQVPKNGVQPNPKYKGWTWEKIYDDLLENTPESEQASGAGGMGEDVLPYDPADNDGVPKAEVERAVGIATEKALQAAQAAGKLSAGMKQRLREAQVEHEPWHQHLRRFMTSLSSREYNWSRIDSRRAVLFGVVSPQMKSEKMGKVVWVIDESGSLSDRNLEAIGAHGSAMCRECAPKEVVIIRHTDRITDVESFEGPDYDIVLERKSTGGTDFRPVFELIEEQHSDAQVVLMFTDMEGPMPREFNGPEVLWVSATTRFEPPFGGVINADFAD